MTENEKRIAGELYDANYNLDLEKERLHAKDLCFQINQLLPSQRKERNELLKQLLGKTEKNFTVESPFMCDYGYMIEIGENFYANHNLMILDGNKVKFGNNVFIGPNCSFYTAEHTLNVKLRNQGLEYAKPIEVGNNVWIGGNVTVLAGVTIGDNAVIGAGSVVTKDIPANAVAVGNPCQVIRNIE